MNEKSSNYSENRGTGYLIIVVLYILLAIILTGSFQY